MPIITGGFTTKNPEQARGKILAAMGGKKLGLPFVATNWESERNANLVPGAKPVESKGKPKAKRTKAAKAKGGK